jgi:hypothetical protein
MILLCRPLSRILELLNCGIVKFPRLVVTASLNGVTAVEGEEV